MNVLDANEIKYLRAQLAERDAEIARLREEIEEFRRFAAAYNEADE